jgi:hypothetical protein
VTAIRRHFVIARSLLRETLPTFVLATGVSTFLLLIRAIFALMELFVSRQVSGVDGLRFVLYNLPHILVLTIPIGTLFAVLMTAGRWSADSEFVALQACGVNLWRAAKPLVLASALLFTLTLWLTVWVMPATNRAFEQLAARRPVRLAAGGRPPRPDRGFPRLPALRRPHRRGNRPVEQDSAVRRLVGHRRAAGRRLGG